MAGEALPVHFIFALALLSAGASSRFDSGCPASCTCSPGLFVKVVCSQQPKEREMDDFIANLSSTVYSLDLSRNNLTVFPMSLCSLSINNLDISHNLITRLEAQPMCLVKMRHFSANDNEINHISSSFFEATHEVETVNLRRNLLSTLDPNTFIWPSLVHLYKVDLSENKLRVIDLWPMKMPHFIHSRGEYSSTIVNVSFNQIEKVVNTVNFHPTQVEVGQFLHFDLRYNKLHSLKELIIDQFDIVNPIDLMGMWDITYYFYFNELYCDCDMFEVMRLVKPFIPYFRDTVSEQLIYMKCFKPDRLNTSVIYTLQEESFQCTLDNCTNIAQCQCVKTPANNTLRVECRQGVFNGLPAISSSAASGITNYELYIKNSNLKYLDLRTFGRKLSVLDVSYNNISRLSPDVFTYLKEAKHILLRNNRLRTLPESVQDLDFTPVKELTLSGNIFNCDCTSLWLKKWMQKHRNKISDVTVVNCASPEWNKDRLIMKVDDSDFVCNKINAPLAIGLSLSTLMILGAFAVVLLYFRNHIQLFLFSRFGWRFSYDYSNEERTYDVFISYSRPDEEWVEKTLADTLENHNPPFRVCIHYKDFEPGAPIAENISRAVEESHCTIIAVSAHFLQSEWCRYEFRLAHTDAITRRSTKVIVVLLEEVAHLDLDRTLKMYLKTNTYLAKHDPRFWSRLLMALPKPSGRVRDYQEFNLSLIPDDTEKGTKYTPGAYVNELAK